MPAPKKVLVKKSQKPTVITEIKDVSVVKQNGKEFYIFVMKASQIEKLTEINRRAEGKQEGYQRVFSPSRTRSIAKYIQSKSAIPGSIVVAFDEGSFNEASRSLSIVGEENVGWVIDGQHRLIGAVEATASGIDIDLPVAAFLGIDEPDQIELFVTINREAKNVPASLYLDLLNSLPRRKTEKEILDERIVDIARGLNNDENGPFYQRLIFTKVAKAGQISTINFARILRPVITKQSGVLGLYTQPEQQGAISNFYRALQNSFPEADKKGIFFKTIGFGAVWRAFPLVFNLTQTRYKTFNVASICKILKQISGFDFEAWNKIGTGTAAEIQAGEDFVTTIQGAFADDTSHTMSLKLD